MRNQKISWGSGKINGFIVVILFGMAVLVMGGFIGILIINRPADTPTSWTENLYYEGMVETQPVIESMQMRIKHLQMDLEAAGFDPCGIDGIYGPSTDRAWNEYETWYMERK